MARARLTTLLVVVLWLQMPAKAEGPEGGRGVEPVTIGVMEFAAKGGISQEKADSLLEILAGEISSLGDIRVMTKSDIQSILALEKLRRLAGCSDEECFAEISGALGMRWMVTGNVSLFGKTFVLSLKLMDVRNVLVAGRVTRRIRGGEEGLIEELPEAVHALFESVADRLGLDVQQQVTVAARHPQPLSQSPSAVWVINREDIEASGATSIPDLLRLVPGMNVVVVSGAFQAVTSRLQWSFEGNHYLVLIDGRESNFDPLGSPVWDVQPIFIEDIERIEIIRGPGSALYGANAFAGVVSITTREIPGRTSAGILTSVGEAGGTALGVRAASKLGDWRLAVSGGANYSGEFVDPRKFARRVWKARALIERRWSASNRLLIDLGISRGEGPTSSTMGAVDVMFAPMTLRTAYDSERVRGQIYWTYANVRVRLRAPIEYSGIRLATFVPSPMEMHIVDANLQWKLPRLFEPLLLVVGGRARATWLGSDHALDAETFADPASPDYHKTGISHWEVRTGVFIHAEYALADWITVTGDTRVDYNTQSELFISPRLAAVLQPVENQYLRMGMARSFRKPSFIETIGHLTVDFPEDSPIQGTAQDTFREFMTRVGGYANLGNEELLAFEIGYIGRFLGGRLVLGLDLYYNRLRNQSWLEPDIVEDQQGLPDLDVSSYMFQNRGPDVDTVGAELSVRFSPSRNLSFLASWTHRQVYSYSEGGFSDESPKNLITLGGRFRTETGLLGSLYAFTRSEFWNRYIENPGGILQPYLHQHMENVILLIGKLGWRFELGPHAQVEVGLRLFLPISPFSAPYFRYYESGGGISAAGNRYGAEQLGRVLTGYLEGSF